MGGTFVHRSYFGLQKADSELDDRKSLFPWTSSDKYFSEAAGISSASVGTL